MSTSTLHLGSPLISDNVLAADSGRLWLSIYRRSDQVVVVPPGAVVAMRPADARIGADLLPQQPDGGAKSQKRGRALRSSCR
ncbi:hypothetical protein SAMN05216215_101849 [Saccharopolyspora shandongensis]|uniref:Uncharacterized protein n=1 Tax=Saccharopolyspora shandongensis TaxID=418495 RepID=A0A1H3G7J5_9PSEU|nr:hypothetical protein SAMN05216215_101849 [Saccharopolyspora shandongensis]